MDRITPTAAGKGSHTAEVRVAGLDGFPVVLTPADLKSGELIYPYEKAKQ